MSVLHILRGMNRGGVETWLMHVLRHLDPERIQMDFLTHAPEPCDYDDEVRALGGRIMRSDDPHHPLAFAKSFRKHLQNYGPYDIIHSHVYFYSGYVLRLASQCGVPVRIAHSHVGGNPLQKVSLPRHIYKRAMRYAISHYANHGLAGSQFAALELFGEAWQTDPRWRILYYGIDLNPFRGSVDRNATRQEFGISSDAFVVGHIGRFVEQKNQSFLIDIVAELVKLLPETAVLLVGDGFLRPEIERKVQSCGLEKQVIFTGTRSDTPRLMRGVMDFFLFPSLYEGMSIVGIDAQATGLPVLFADSITPEIEIIPELVHWMSLSDSPAQWAQKIVEIKQKPPAITPEDALKRIENTPFNIRNGITALLDFYQEALGRNF